MSDRYEAEQRRFDELDAAGRAASALTAARMAELAGQQQTAYRRLSAAQGRLTRAQRDGDLAKITAARQRLTDVSADADRISNAVIAEMRCLHRAQLDRLRALLGQMRCMWDAGQEMREALTTSRPGPP